MSRVQVQQSPFDLAQEELLASNATNNCGAIVAFVGKVRGKDGQVPLSHLWLEHFEGVTQAEILKIIKQAQQRWQLQYVKVIHRIGKLNVGENIVLVLTAASHRQDAYLANCFIMDYLKIKAPFWKKEHFQDDSVRWVAAKTSDTAVSAKWQQR